jgi:response regulator of citrate/malate metabolism
MLDTIKAFKEKHGREPNKSELHRLTGMSRVTIQKRIEELIKTKKIKKAKPVHLLTADYMLV